MLICLQRKGVTRTKCEGLGGRVVTATFSEARDMEKVIQIVTTASDRKIIEKIGRELIEKRLIACAQIVGPIQSIYRWKGKVEDTNEWLLLMKSRESLYSAIEAEFKRLHPYEIPEIIATSIERGLPEYMDWVTKETE